MEDLSREAESCDIALEQVKNVQRERDILQKQYYEQSCMLVDRENEIKRLLTQIEQMSVTAETREVCYLDLCVLSFFINVEKTFFCLENRRTIILVVHSSILEKFLFRVLL